MQKIEYDLPIFNDEDTANLNEYSTLMANAIKGQIDKFGNPLIFKGTVQTLVELNVLTNVKSGEIYRVDNENKNYIYNGTDWVVYSDNVDLSAYQNEVNTQINNIIEHKYTKKITESIDAGTAFAIPCSYKVNQDTLDVYLNGEKLIKSSDSAGTDGHYQEVGEGISNQMKTTTDWSLETGDILEFVVRGDYSVTDN